MCVCVCVLCVCVCVCMCVCVCVCVWTCTHMRACACVHSVCMYDLKGSMILDSYGLRTYIHIGLLMVVIQFKILDDKLIQQEKI